MNHSGKTGQETGGMLAPYRGLDLTGERGYLSGRLMADLGADIIKIEKPGGDPGRNIGPFYKDIPHPEKSLFWFAFNINKRGITLDIETGQGQEIFKRLVATADFVIDSFAPGYMDKLGLGYSVLSQINPRIITTSITPFGERGPYRDYKSYDIIDAALGGTLFTTGDPDRPPVRVSYPQTFQLAAAEAAVGTLMAILYRNETGEGQHVEIETYRATVGASYDVVTWWYGNKEIRRRQGSIRLQPDTGVKGNQMWKCKDGYVSYFFFAGQLGVFSNRELTKWMDSEGYADDFIKKVDWEKFDWSTTTQDFVDKFEAPAAKFFLAHTKDELLEGALKKGLQIYPLNVPRDILASKQLKAREYWEEMEHPELGTTITYPGAFIKSSEAPIRMRFRAPTIGEHNEDIYKGELGFSTEELLVLKQANII